MGQAIRWQLAAIVLSAPWYCYFCGLLQWVALIPLYISRRRAGYPLMAKGVLRAGFFGMLVNAFVLMMALGLLGDGEI